MSSWLTDLDRLWKRARAAFDGPAAPTPTDPPPAAADPGPPPTPQRAPGPSKPGPPSPLGERQAHRFLRQRLAPLVRTVAEDALIQVRPGPRTGYLIDWHIVEYAESLLELADESMILAIMAHEAAHVRLSRYHQQLPGSVRAVRQEMEAANCLEDARINRWVMHHYSGLRSGMVKAEELAFGGWARWVGEDLADSMPAHWRFIWCLRARACQQPEPVERDERVSAAIEAALPAMQALLDDWPRDPAADEETVLAHSERVSAALVDPILPLFRALRGQARGEAAASGAEATRVLDELERRVEQRTPLLGGSVWQQWQRGRRQAQTRGRALSRSKRAPLARYRTAREETAPRVARFCRALEEALAPNSDPWLDHGFPAGRSISLREAFLFERDRDRYRTLWQRPVHPDERRYRLALVADYSESMKGAPLRSLRHCLVLLLEAAARLRLPTAVVGFGLSGPPEDQVALWKDPQEPLDACRGRLSRRLFSDRLGGETPMAEALDRCRTALAQPFDGTDLVVMITDGRPCATREGFFRAETKIGVVGDDGVRKDPIQVSGYRRLWRKDYRQVVERATRRFETRDSVLIGVGIGDEAEVEGLFPRARRFANAAEFSEGFPDLVQAALIDLLGPGA